MARVQTIAYGAVTIGDPPYSLHQPPEITSDDRAIRIAAQVVVSGTSLADRQGNEDTLEAEFAKPRQDVTYTLNGVSRAYTEADYTGLGIQASSRKTSDPDFMGLTALYEIEITFQRPFNLSGESYIRDAQSSLFEDGSGRRTIEVSGQCTADDSTPRSARTQLAAVVDAYVQARADEVDNSATWEELAATEQWDRYDQVVTWTRVVREVIANQGASGLDVSSIRNETLRTRVVTTAPGDAAVNTLRLVESIAEFSCNVLHTVTQDLETVYTTEVRPLLISRLTEATGGGAIAIMDEVKDYDKNDNTIRAQIRFATARAVLLESQVTSSVQGDRGVSLIPVWDGNPHSKAIIPSPADLVRVDTVGVLVRGDEAAALSQARALFTRAEWSPESFGNGSIGPRSGGAITGEEAAQSGLGGSGGGWLVMRESQPSTSTRTLGTTQKFTVTALVVSRLAIYVRPQTRPTTGLGGSGRRFSSVAP